MVATFYREFPVEHVKIEVVGKVLGNPLPFRLFEPGKPTTVKMLKLPQSSRGEYMSKKSETVYPEIWGIFKLSGLINQKIIEIVYQNFLKTVPSNFQTVSDT